MKMLAPKTHSNSSNSYSSKPLFDKSREATVVARLQKEEKPSFDHHSLESYTIFPKLMIGQPGNNNEQEADAMAERVVQRMESSKSIPVNQTCGSCDKGEKLQKKEQEDDKMEVKRKSIFKSDAPANKHIQTKATNGDGFTNLSLKSQFNTSKGKGFPLSKDSRNEMEIAFGTDFSQVRIHTDFDAIQMNKKLNSRAFTYGPDIFFDRNEYSPQSLTGKKLLAHELTHVVQQNQSKGKPVIQCRKRPSPPAKPPQNFPVLDQIVRDNELSWSIVVNNSKKFKQVTQWIAHGNKALRLLKEHVQTGTRHIKQGASEKSRIYIDDLIPGDLLTLNYILFHLLVHANFLHNQPNISKVWAIINKHEFSGKKDATKKLKAYENALNQFLNNEATFIKIIKFTSFFTFDKKTKQGMGPIEKSSATQFDPAKKTETEQVFKQAIGHFLLEHKNAKERMDIIAEKLANISFLQMVMIDTGLILLSVGGPKSGPKIKTAKPRVVSKGKPKSRPDKKTPKEPKAGAKGQKNKKGDGKKTSSDEDIYRRFREEVMRNLRTGKYFKQNNWKYVLVGIAHHDLARLLARIRRKPKYSKVIKNAQPRKDGDKYYKITAQVQMAKGRGKRATKKNSSRILARVKKLPSGTNKNQAILMNWYGSMNIYPTIKLIPKKSGDKKIWGGNLPASRPINATPQGRTVLHVSKGQQRGRKFAKKTQTIGIASKFIPRKGKVMEKVLATPRRTGMQGAFRTLLSNYNFSWSNFQADHVQDLRFKNINNPKENGDVPENLWPLTTAKNQGISQSFTRQRVIYQKANKAKQNSPDNTSFLGKFFEIKSIQ